MLMNKNRYAIGIGIISYVIFETLNYIRDPQHFEQDNAILFTIISFFVFVGMGYLIVYYLAKKSKK